MSVLPPGFAAAQSLDPDEEAARRHFARGIGHYDAGAYQAALVEFETVKRIHDSPALDYNIARCYDRLERYQEAVAAYQRYVTAKPDVPDAAQVRQRIEVLRQRLAASPPPVTPSPPVAPSPPPVAPSPPVVASPVVVTSPPPRSARRFAAPIALGAGAVVAAAVGAGLLGWVKADYDAAAGPSGCRPCSNARIDALEHRADGGYALLGVAGALVIVDAAVLGVLLAHHKRPSEARAQAARAWR